MSLLLPLHSSLHLSPITVTETVAGTTDDGAVVAVAVKPTLCYVLTMQDPPSRPETSELTDQSTNSGTYTTCVPECMCITVY